MSNMGRKIAILIVILFGIGPYLIVNVVFKKSNCRKQKRRKKIEIFQ